VHGPGQGPCDHPDPLVGLRSLPREEDHPPTRAEPRADVRERGDRVAEEHRRRARDREVELSAGERMDLHVTLGEPHVRDAFVTRSARRELDHAGRQVDAERRTSRCDTRRITRGQPRTATDVEHPIVRRDCCGIEERSVVAREPAVEVIGVRRPIRRPRRLPTPAAGRRSTTDTSLAESAMAPSPGSPRQLCPVTRAGQELVADAR
jgi:hypothetical protein